MKVMVGLLMLVAMVAAGNYFLLPPPYRYTCSAGKCNREIINTPTPPPPPRDQNIIQYTTLAECNLVCGKYGSLWPRPEEATLDYETIPFLPQNIYTKVSAGSPQLEEMLLEQAHYFKRNLHFLHPDYKHENKGPFREYKQKYNNSASNFNQYGEQPRTSKLGSYFGLASGSRLDKQKFEGQTQAFSQVNKQDRPEQIQMRYEAISPFNNQKSSPLAKKYNFVVNVTVAGAETDLSMETDESYNMDLKTNKYTTTATILAASYYGARHAMESLSQMIAYNELYNSLQVVKSAAISDAPAFKYRGIMLDTAHNFYPKEKIMSLLDTMATNKLNTFHWHISDASSFPMFTPRQPQMSYYGAYSPRKIYYPQDIHEVVEYANQRGIRVIPELAAPAHAGAGWNFEELERNDKLVLCNNPDDIWFNHCDEPPCGQLNPSNPKVYGVLKNVYSDILEAFNPEFFHMGGNDVDFECWSSSSDIVDYLTKQNREDDEQGLFKLWNEFQTMALKKLRESIQETGVSKEVQPMIYSSSLTRDDLDDRVYTVQITDDANSTNIQEYISRGYKIVFSNADVWNFEGPAPSWISKAETYKKDAPQPSWKQVYENSPVDMLVTLGLLKARPDNRNRLPAKQVLGGEGMVWSYQTDAESVQSTIWPRGAALAERLWTDPPQNRFQVDEVEYRMASHRERMVNRGIRAEAIQPEFCFQNQKACSSDEFHERF